MKPLPYAYPVLTCQKAREFESRVLSDSAAEWSAMKLAGVGIAEALIRDYQEISTVPDHLRIVALVGKGNNGGDALITCGHLLALFPRANVQVILSAETSEMKPLAQRAYEQLGERVHSTVIAAGVGVSEVTLVLSKVAEDGGIDICIDGLLGVSFVPPLRGSTLTIIEAVNAFESIRLRASVDLPSGRGDVSAENPFIADFTYATGIAKQVLFDGLASCGRIRYVDLGFFDGAFEVEGGSIESVVHPRVLEPLRKLRSASAEKRAFGHLYIVGGSVSMPGALLMSVKAAVRSGVGLVTAFAPASVAAALSPQVPEAMWVPWPATNNGTLDPRAISILVDRLGSATAVLCGPGMGRDRGTELIVQQLIQTVRLPLVLDADALRQKAIEFAPKRRSDFGPLIATPHMGEFMRIAKLSAPDFSVSALMDFCRAYKVTVVLKGANTRICDGRSILYNTHGGPVLSRGGSGDLLAGLIGGMIAQKNTDTQTSVARAVMLHGLAAQRLAREKGQVLVNTTQLLDYLPAVLRNHLG